MKHTVIYHFNSEEPLVITNETFSNIDRMFNNY
jgi:hypothetical protein